MSLNIRKFKFKDLGLVNERSQDTGFGKHEIEKTVAQSDYAYTFTLDDRPVAFAGATTAWPGVLQGWMLTSNMVRGHGLDYIRKSRALIKAITEMAKAHRWHFIVDGNVPENIRFAKLLGFHHECTWKKATSDKRDALIFAYFPEVS